MLRCTAEGSGTVTLASLERNTHEVTLQFDYTNFRRQESRHNGKGISAHFMHIRKACRDTVLNVAITSFPDPTQRHAVPPSFQKKIISPLLSTNAFSENDRLSIQLHKNGIKFRENCATAWKYVQRYNISKYWNHSPAQQEE
jgi:hypothetical protein